MTTMNKGEAWRVRFDPADGDEIKQIRTAVIVGVGSVGRLRLKIVVPITEWKSRYENYPWFVRLILTQSNGLTKESGADAFQVKSVSDGRFLDCLVTLTASEMADIATAVSVCVGAA